MSDVVTVSTRVDGEIDNQLQTVVDAEGTSKAEYLRSALEKELQEDHNDLSKEDEIKAEINQLGRKVEVADTAENVESGLPDPLGLFK